MSTTQQLADTFKSQDTEEWFDIHFTRPIGLWWAKRFAHFHIHPNTVTICSILLGIIAAVMFYHRALGYNIAGVLLLMWANFFDSADGQLARMTEQKTQWGRILDGFAGDVWFYCIYTALCLRLMPQMIPGTDWLWGYSIFIPAAIAGLACHARQSQLADYYRNIHLYFLKGKAGSELDNAAQQRELLQNTPRKGNFWWRLFLWGYANYTKTQENLTPGFQALMQYLKKYHAGTLPTPALQQTFLEHSRPLMKYTNMLTFNLRAFILYITCLCDVPWVYFLSEMTLFVALYCYMHYKHEQLCRTMLQTLEHIDLKRTKETP